MRVAVERRRRRRVKPVMRGAPAVLFPKPTAGVRKLKRRQPSPVPRVVPRVRDVRQPPLLVGKWDAGKKVRVLKQLARRQQAAPRVRHRPKPPYSVVGRRGVYPRVGRA